MKSAFIDSGGFIAFLDASDRQHAATLALFANPPRVLMTSMLVVSETYSWLLHRMGEEAARRLLALLDDLKAISIVDADAGHLREVRARLDAQRGRKLTFVDASILVLLAKHRVGTVWGTDRDLGLEGASVVPGPPKG